MCRTNSTLIVSFFEGSNMTAGDRYRVKAAELFGLAKEAKQLHLQVEYAATAASYLRLAEQADRNALTDVVYETPAENSELR
jgi:hypothetical protein